MHLPYGHFEKINTFSLIRTTPIPILITFTPLNSCYLISLNRFFWEMKLPPLIRVKPKGTCNDSATNLPQRPASHISYPHASAFSRQTSRSAPRPTRGTKTPTRTTISICLISPEPAINRKKRRPKLTRTLPERQLINRNSPSGNNYRGCH